MRSTLSGSRLGGALGRSALVLCLAGLSFGVAGQAAALDIPGVVWETNDTDPPIGDPSATKGGTFYDYITSYPLTLRLVGPNSNDAFAGWNRSFSMNMSLILRHPTTDRYIPCMATHWSIQPDHKTVYYKLDPDAKWSDGQPVTADDYLFTNEMMRSEHIVDPYYNQYWADHFEAVEKLDDYTIKIVGLYESWRPMEDFGMFPLPRHSTQLGPDWVEKANLVPGVVQGPYVITEAVSGQYVVFSRIKGWWGENKRYFKGMYNVDKIHLKVISDVNAAFDFFKKGEISHYTVTSARRWATELDFPAIKNGWVHKKRLFVDWPQGLYGFAMNLEQPIFRNKDFRKAIQYTFDFDELNNKLMFGAYYRMASCFEGSEYTNPRIKPYGFDPRKAREHLRAAGFTKRGRDGIFVNEHGQRAAFTFTYGSKSLERHFTVVKQKFRRLGIDMVLQLLEPGTAFERGLERQYELTLMSRTTQFYPSPKQYFGSVFKKTTNNNNIWSFGTARTDSLIDIFEKDMDRGNRIRAMAALDSIVQDEAFYVPFWRGPYIRFLYWDYVRWPAFYMPKRTEQYLDWQVFWVDEARNTRLAEAMKNGTSLGEDLEVDADPYGVKARLESGDNTSVLGQ